MIPALAAFWILGCGAGWAWASSDALQGGREAMDLFQGLPQTAALEDYYETASRAEAKMAGSRAQYSPTKDAISAGGGEWKKAASGLTLHADPKGGSEPVPVPVPPDPQDPGKKKRDWGKILEKWLPIVLFYLVGVQTILSPLGVVQGAAQGIAMAALIGTATQLYRELRPKKPTPPKP